MMHPEQITDSIAFHAEGPVWHDSWGGLRFVDMLAGDLLTMAASGEVSRLHVGSPIAAFVRPRASGGYVVGTERGIALSDSPFAAPTEYRELWSEPNVRMNEGCVDPWGRLYAGSMPYDKTPGAAKLYRIDGEGCAVVVENNVTTSNGMDFTADGTRAYYNDTATRQTDVYDVTAAGELANRRAFFHTGEGTSPDGLAVDSRGNVWCALNRKGTVRLYSPQAEILGEWKLPCPGVTAVTLGGPDGKDVFITTSKEMADVPGAGAIWHMRAEVSGQPTREYAG
ncbi:SMP-30/gluconolactonase/LRE family protein [Ancrocorticia sp.]|uniref:SMP-30/gluconolactonase/LRE family protein n=1 Tax=Ancrocorticia sp. TaxID=2593684 RepID=UPI003F8FE370